MHFFVTGHTGFKGSWLILLLKELGHEVSGYSLPPVEGGMFHAADLAKDLTNNFIGDIRDFEKLKTAIEACSPDFAIHMAAQPLVLRSYEDPLETYTINVDGTLNFLRAISTQKTPPISLVITTDKVYRDDGKGSYSESDPLGGHDPYSASKAMADILTQSWAATNPHLRLHIARAGNVIGGFDVSHNRLLPDLNRSIAKGSELIIRNPNAVRPWQHVLDCLLGYLLYLKAADDGKQLPVALNFGPDPSSLKAVSEVVALARALTPELRIKFEKNSNQMKETQLLTLDSSLAENLLDWENQISFESSVRMSLDDCGANLGSSRNSESGETAMIQIADFLRSSPKSQELHANSWTKNV